MGKGIHLQGILPNMAVPGTQTQAQSQRPWSDPALGQEPLAHSPIAFHARINSNQPGNSEETHS